MYFQALLKLDRPFTYWKDIYAIKKTQETDTEK